MIKLVDFNKRTKSLKTKGANLSSAVAEHFRDAIGLFKGEGNHNIQIINDCIDIAKVTKGMRVKGAVAWFEEMIPHKQLGQAGAWHFGAKLSASTRVTEIEAGCDSFLVGNPNWYDYTVESIETNWTAIKYLKSQEKTLNGHYAKGDLSKDDFDKIKVAFSKMELEDVALGF